MKIVMLARSPGAYSHKRIVEAARARGHTIDVINTLSVSIKLASKEPGLLYHGCPLEDYDAVIPRIGASITFYGLAVLRQFEMMGVYPLNESVAIGRSRDKLRCLQLLSRRGIGLPVTAFTHYSRQAEQVVEMVGGPPVVIKLLEGTQGIGVVLADSVKSAKSVIEAFGGVKVNILVQEFIKEAEGADIRLLVVGDRVVACMQRKGPPGEFRSNLHRGGSGSSVNVTAAERAVAIKAAKTLGLNVCGVDLLRSNHGPVVMEVNSSPGIEGLEQASGADAATPMIEFLERNAVPGKTRTRGKG